jgi:hypothetical protein
MIMLKIAITAPVSNPTPKTIPKPLKREDATPGHSGCPPHFWTASQTVSPSGTAMWNCDDPARRPTETCQCKLQRSRILSIHANIRCCQRHTAARNQATGGSFRSSRPRGKLGNRSDSCAGIPRRISNTINTPNAYIK